MGGNVGSALLQVAAQHLGKQVVVAVPAPLVVEGDHKQVRPLERFQHRLTPLLTRHRIAEWSAEAFQDTGVQAETSAPERVAARAPLRTGSRAQSDDCR